LRTDGKPVILLLGDSLIDYGEWHRRLPGYLTISSGVPGERAGELLRRLPVGPERKSPDTIVVMTGTNNIIFGDFSFIDTTRQIITRLQDRFGRVPLLVTSLLPYEIPGIIGTIHAANDGLREVCREGHAVYFDLCTHFENSQSRLFDYDGVHLSNTGYELWASVLDEYLLQLLANRPD